MAPSSKAHQILLVLSSEQRLLDSHSHGAFERPLSGEHEACMSSTNRQIALADLMHGPASERVRYLNAQHSGVDLISTWLQSLFNCQPTSRYEDHCFYSSHALHEIAHTLERSLHVHAPLSVHPLQGWRFQLHFPTLLHYSQYTSAAWLHPELVQTINHLNKTIPSFDFAPGLDGPGRYRWDGPSFLARVWT